MKHRYRSLGGVGLSLALAGSVAWADTTPDSTAPPTHAQLAAKYKAILQSLHPMHGDVAVPGAGATLHLGQSYYFLNAEDSRKVLVEGWQNPPDTVSNVLGMVFPEGSNFTDPSGWGAVVTYQALGYIADKDARSTDYNKLLDQLRQGEDADNAQRQKEGGQPIHLVGWAQSPAYDSANHTVTWARDLHIGDQKDDTLNYDVRELGRHGVLSLNVIASMSQLGQIRAAAASLGPVANFDVGARYADYQSGVDKKAAYGVAGLIAAGAGVALAQKAGLIGLILLFAKKIGIFVVAGFAGLGARFRRWFGGKKKTVP